MRLAYNLAALFILFLILFVWLFICVVREKSNISEISKIEYFEKSESIELGQLYAVMSKDDTRKHGEALTIFTKDKKLDKYLATGIIDDVQNDAIKVKILHFSKVKDYGDLVECSNSEFIKTLSIKYTVCKEFLGDITIK